MSIYTEHKTAGNSDGLFLKLKDGDSVKIRIAYEPAIYNLTYEDKTSTRYAWTVWNRSEERAQVFSGGVSIFRQIAELVEEWGEPTEYDITVKRTGDGLETKYSVIPVPKSVDLTAEQREACEAIDLPKTVKGWWVRDFDKQAKGDKSLTFSDGTPIPSDDEVVDLEDIR